ncbi:MAG: hypothetical protein IPI61_14725 [Syntrophaceae bacterium]|nr:hypothetical protein [Syntrophaceae bacterium]
MKILFSGYHNPHYETVTEYMERALRALGHEVIVYDDRRHVIPGRIRSRVGWLHRLDLACINRRLAEAARRGAVDAVVVTGGDRILPETVDRIRAMGIVTALWTTDPPKGHVPHLKVAPRYDHIFCQGSEFVELLRETGTDRARWLPVGCEPASHHPIELTEEERRLWGSDVVFVGSHYPEREALFEALADFDLALWGRAGGISAMAPPSRAGSARPTRSRPTGSGSTVPAESCWPRTTGIPAGATPCTRRAPVSSRSWPAGPSW